MIGPILTGYTHSSQVDCSAYKLFTTIVINCSMSIVFLLFVYDLGTLLLTVVVRAFLFLFRCSGFLLPLGGTTTPRSPSLDKIVFCATQQRNSMF